jgi:hypothetical protein
MATMVPAAPTAAVTVRVALLVGDGTHSTTPGKQCQQSGIVQGARPEGAWLFGRATHLVPQPQGPQSSRGYVVCNLNQMSGPTPKAPRPPALAILHDATLWWWCLLCRCGRVSDGGGSSDGDDDGVCDRGADGGNGGGGGDCGHNVTGTLPVQMTARLTASWSTQRLARLTVRPMARPVAWPTTWPTAQLTVLPVIWLPARLTLW